MFLQYPYDLYFYNEPPATYNQQNGEWRTSAGKWEFVCKCRDELGTDLGGVMEIKTEDGKYTKVSTRIFLQKPPKKPLKIGERIKVLHGETERLNEPIKAIVQNQLSTIIWL